MRYGHQESGRAHESNLTQEQEKMVKRVMLTMKDFDIQRGQQDCEATLRETNFDFDKAIDLLISPNYHPWINNPINRGAHGPSNYGGSNNRRREHNDRRPHNSEQRRRQTVKNNESNDDGDSGKVVSHEKTLEKRKTSSDSASKSDGSKKVLHITSKSSGSKEGVGSLDSNVTDGLKEPIVVSKQPTTHTPKKDSSTTGSAAPVSAPIKVVITTQRPADKAATQETSHSSKPDTATVTTSAAPSKISIKIAPSKTTKKGNQPSDTAPKSQDDQKSNIQLTLKPSGGQQAPPIDVMALEKNLGRPGESAPQMAMVQQPYTMASNIPVMSAPVTATQPNQQPVQVVYVPVYYPSQGPMGEMNPFPPTTSLQMKNPDMLQMPGYQMVHMPMPMMNGMQGQVIAPMQVPPGQQTQHFAFPFTGEAQTQSK